jgi:NCS2 family nucleobase:cation symporter-2
MQVSARRAEIASSPPARPYLRPSDLVYAVDEAPPPLRLALIGLQYAVMTAIYLIIVAIILRHARVAEAQSVAVMGIACIALAVGTLLQALPYGPIGSGFLAPPVFSATYLGPSVLAAEAGGLRLVLGMTLFAGLVELLVGLAISRLRLIVTPILSGLTVFVVGLQLGVVGIGEFLDVRHAALLAFHRHVAVTALTLSACIALSIWGRGTMKLLCSLIGLLTGIGAGWGLGVVTSTQLAGAAHIPWFALPHLALPDYRLDPGLLPAFFAAGVAAALRAVGVVTTCQRINNAAWRRPDIANIRKGVLADGLGTVISAGLGAPGMNIAPSLVGISSATGATSRAIAFAAAAILALFGLSPKLSGLFLLVPQEIAGSLLVFTASFMITGGMQIMLSRPAGTRGVYVIGVSTLLALSENVFPNYFRDLSPIARSLASSPLALGLTAAIVLTLVFRFGARQRAETQWRAAEDAVAAATGLLQDKAREWKVADDIAAVAISQAQSVFDFILREPEPPPDGSLRASFNGVELRIDIAYEGAHAPTLPASERPPAAAGYLDNEEEAAFVGLRDFLHSLAADRKLVRQHRGRVLVRLSYAV